MLMAEVDGDNDGYSMGDMADMIEGWRGATLTRDNADGTMDTVVVYTDIGIRWDGGFGSLRLSASLPTRRPEVLIDNNDAWTNDAADGSRHAA